MPESNPHAEWAQWGLLNIDKKAALSRREEVREALDKVVEQARIEVPPDYDIEAAFADVLSLGAVGAPPEIQPAIVRLALFIFDRLPPRGDT